MTFENEYIDLNIRKNIKQVNKLEKSNFIGSNRLS
ncbi:hypothetical protein A3Q56_04300, partial [Intoshia linei]